MRIDSTFFPDVPVIAAATYILFFQMPRTLREPGHCQDTDEQVKSKVMPFVQKKIEEDGKSSLAALFYEIYWVVKADFIKP